MRRKQGEDEPVADYITCLQALFERLDPPWQLSEQLSYAHKNMLPRLRVRRTEIYDFRSLKTLASQVEECYDLDRQPTQARSIFPELAYRSTLRHNKNSKPIAAAGIPASKAKGKKTAATESRKKLSVNALDGTTSDPKSSTSATNNTRAAEIKCWNCDEKGHRSRDCKQARNLHCYRCGKNSTLRARVLSARETGKRVARSDPNDSDGKGPQKYEYQRHSVVCNAGRYRVSVITVFRDFL